MVIDQEKKKVEQFKERMNSSRENPSEITWDFGILVGTELYASDMQSLQAVTYTW